MTGTLLKSKQQAEKNLLRLKAGEETGLNYFYNAYYKHYAYRAIRFVKEEVVASSMAQEAFLRLWLMRVNIRDVAHLHEFLGMQIREAGKAYYGKTINRFYRSMLQLDGIEDYQEFMLGYELEEADEEDLVYLEQLEQEKQQQLEKINQLFPHVNEQQQLFIRLCLKYSFNYERIAHHLGGISDYEVGMRVEQCIANLKAALADTARLDNATRSKPLVTEGMLSEEQAQVFTLRYEMQYSFEEIAAALHLDDGLVKQLFIQAHAVIKKNKKSA
ncbi:DNA-directed RNA polymerase specialized sigma subunit, sigma24 family [bacterium A37T11]|nr:DNA-directed RNA polymerase specialized sigma subunit, sigma24 family [bacterium A37T11]